MCSTLINHTKTSWHWDFSRLTQIQWESNPKSDWFTLRNLFHFLLIKQKLWQDNSVRTAGTISRPAECVWVCLQLLKGHTHTHPWAWILRAHQLIHSGLKRTTGPWMHLTAWGTRMLCRRCIQGHGRRHLNTQSLWAEAGRARRMEEECTYCLTDDGVFDSIDAAGKHSKGQRRVEAEVEEHVPSLPTDADCAATKRRWRNTN